MSRTPDAARRIDLLDRAVDFVSAHGLSDLSLRPLAKALGTSPRVLLYYFGSKDELIVAIIRRGRARQQATMSNLKLTTALAPGELMRILWRQWTDAKHLPLMRLFFEVYTLALAKPARFPGFLEGAIEEWLGVLEGCSTLSGYTREDARAFATMLIGAFRGFMLDLTATRDRKRVDAAVRLWIGMLDGYISSRALPGETLRDATA
ncbi:MAG: TetR/AcrR family transcriptional regulator [Candidatus Eremiobacteraeota bacterium]|nr:TetR/AcrR family transcriptional regulator [Candidatus Eremiobacteraeota bacterium]